jgi:hypothetical protein
MNVYTTITKCARMRKTEDHIGPQSDLGIPIAGDGIILALVLNGYGAPA